MRFDAVRDSFRTLDTYKFGMQTISTQPVIFASGETLNLLALLPV